MDKCGHLKTHNEDWPDGGGIEVCDECGMPRDRDAAVDRPAWIWQGK